jgi:hypothetical protein
MLEIMQKKRSFSRLNDCFMKVFSKLEKVRETLYFIGLFSKND